VEKPTALDGVEKARKEIASLEFLAPHVDLLGKLDVELPDYDPAMLNKLQDKLSSAKAALEVHEVVKGRAVRLRKRMEELDAELVTEEPLKLLLEGYSDKAVKKMVIDAISNHLVTTLNSYSKLVFSNYTFEFVWGTQVQLLVHRPKLPTTDVRKLSGAESKLFTLILVLALMKFVPKRKRLNLLVLDEPTASFSKETTEVFHQLLGQLGEVIPSILVVTPKSEERVEGAMEYTVVRDKAGSRIVKGHPDDI
jgi:DNA repair exonuclease SbcCD ATPase subunit